MTIDSAETARLWWQQPFRMFQTNLRETDAGLNVDRVLDFIEGYGANAWLIAGIEKAGASEPFPTVSFLSEPRNLYFRSPTKHPTPQVLAADNDDYVGDPPE